MAGRHRRRSRHTGWEHRGPGRAELVGAGVWAVAAVVYLLAAAVAFHVLTGPP
jgi:hypothetical protein